MVDWNNYAKFGNLQSVIDFADVNGYKNKYINILHHKILLNEIGNKLKGKKVLDLGCGIGRFTQFLQDSGAAEVVGVDSCEEMLSLNINCKTVCAPIYKLPFEDNSFDAVLCVWVLEYLTDDELILTANEIERILVTGGCVYTIEKISGGYEGRQARYLLNYSNAFKRFRVSIARSIAYRDDKIINIVKKGLIPECCLSILADLHLKFTAMLSIKSNEYLDYFVLYRKRY